ncbi:MAG TPA: cation:proton antiporter, partial [Burkholderiaceae bacterium]|nr:cation:proton antiporter [Burkholderiaceae bacterium]
MLASSALELTLLLLSAAVLGVVAFRLMHLPPMLGYLAVGALIGPHALGLVPETTSARHLAEFGVVFLMFSIGLEFNLSKLRALRATVFGLGLAQVIATIALAVAGMLTIAWLFADFAQGRFAVSWPGAFALGAALSMSSTAIVVKLLVEKLALETPHGRQIIGVLLFQDLAVVPLLILVPSIAKGGGNGMWHSLGI